MPKRVLFNTEDNTYVIERITDRMAAFMERVHIEWDNRQPVMVIGPFTNNTRVYIKDYMEVKEFHYPVEVKAW